jgi:predicted SprT family Zn-dependent metalloprotease
MSTGRERAKRRMACRYLQTLATLWNRSFVSSLPVEVNERLSRAAGRWLPRRGVVQLSPGTVSGDLRLRREVLCHEAAHAVVSRLHGDKVKPHGPEWRELVRAVGFEPTASAVRCGVSRQTGRPQVIFRHTCPVCHFSKRAKRRMPRWRCPECRAAGLEGTLRIERMRSTG